MDFSHGGQKYFLQRYPKTSNRSLQPVSAATELLLAWTEDRTGDFLLLEDRFGALATVLAPRAVFVVSYASQEKALLLNLAANERSFGATRVVPLLPSPATTTASQALLLLPKSLDLFEFYLSWWANCAAANAPLAVGFMTRHFTPRLLEIAGRYASSVEQTRARKKARLLLLSGWKTDVPKAEELINEVGYEASVYRQYYGVFSADHVDYATQFLLDNWPDLPTPARMLDLACGNGVIGLELLKKYPTAELTATDDFALAAASARLNGVGAVLADGLEAMDSNSQDLVVTNPPFHFGYENNIEVSLGLFKQVLRVLKPGGRFVLVANRHLNYATHLEQLFRTVDTVAENEKFVVYSCTSASN